MKQLSSGEALLMTADHTPVVSLPICTADDIQSIASIAGDSETTDYDKLYALGIKMNCAKKCSQIFDAGKNDDRQGRKLSQA